MTCQANQLFCFDDVQVEPHTARVLKAGSPVSLEPKSFRLLLFLIEQKNRVVGKTELLDVVWKDTTVTENALTHAITKLRKSIGDDPKTPRYIQTVHTRGYRFVAEVEIREDGAPNAGREKATINQEAGEAGLGKRITPVITVPTSPQAGKATMSLRRAPSLKSIWIISVIGLCFIGGALLWKGHNGTIRSRSAIAKQSVAVLPFKSSRGDTLGVEIADAMTTRLGNSSQLVVAPITSVLPYTELERDPTALGNLLKVDYVLSGEIGESGNDVTVKLIRIQDGASLLVTTFDEKFNDIFQLEESLSARVLNNLMVTLDHEETQRLRKRYTENRQAYQTFLRAHSLMNKGTKEDTEKGIEYFGQAISLDPKFAMAYAGLADCYRRLGNYGVAPAEFVPKSRTAVLKALELDETIAYAHSMLGLIAYNYDWDFSRADREYTRARELEPTLVHQWYPAYLLAVNRSTDAEIEYKRYADFLPFARGTFGIAQYYYFMHQYDLAGDVLRKKLENDPDYYPLHEMLGLVYEQQGRSDEAIAHFQKAIELSHGDHGLGSLGHLYAALGRRDDALKLLRSLHKQSSHRYVSPYEEALIYTGLGETDKAFALLERAYKERSLAAPSLRFEPRLNALRNESPFQDFTRRVGLVP